MSKEKKPWNERFRELKRRPQFVPKTQEDLLNLAYPLTHALERAHAPSSSVLKWLLEPASILSLIQLNQAECESIATSLNKNSQDKAAVDKNLQFMEGHLSALECYTETHQQHIEAHLTLAGSFLRAQTLLCLPGILYPNGKSLLKQRIAALNEAIHAITKELTPLEGCSERVPALENYEKRKAELVESYWKLVQTEKDCQKIMEEITTKVSEMVLRPEAATDKSEAATDKIKMRLKALTSPPEALKASIKQLEKKVNALNADLIVKKQQAQTLEKALRVERLRLLHEDTKTVEILKKRHNAVDAAQTQKSTMWREHKDTLAAKYGALSFEVPIQNVLTSQQVTSFNEEVKKVKTAYTNADQGAANKIEGHAKHILDRRVAFSDASQTVAHSFSSEPFTPVAERAKAIEGLKKQLEGIKSPLANHAKDIDRNLQAVEATLKNVNEVILCNKIKTYAGALSKNLFAHIQALEEGLKQKQTKRVCKGVVANVVNMMLGWFGFGRPDFVARFEAFEQRQVEIEAQKESAKALRKKITTLIASNRDDANSYSEVFDEYMEYAEKSAQPLKEKLHRLNNRVDKAADRVSAARTLQSEIALLKTHHTYAQEGLKTLSDLTSLHSKEIQAKKIQPGAATRRVKRQHSLPMSNLDEGLNPKLTAQAMADTINEGTETHIGIGNGSLMFWISVLKVLNSNKPLLLNARDEDGNTLLHCAIYAKDLDGVRYLLSQGAQIDSKNDDGECALDVAKAAWYEEAFSCTDSALVAASQLENNTKQIYTMVKAAEKVAIDAQKVVLPEESILSTSIFPPIPSDNVRGYTNKPSITIQQPDISQVQTK